jgi:uncharacterized caspase-like protein
MRISPFCRMFLVIGAVLASGNAFAGRRVALIIGNSKYEHVANLPNPASDAATMAKLLTNVGFDHVELKINLNEIGFRRELLQFAKLSSGADMAVIYYAGHGMEIDGENYLIPVDAKLKTDLDVDYETMPLDRLLRSVQTAHTRLIILDACRDNPFISRMSRLTATRSIGRGLARIEPNTSNTLIAFAAKAGSIAADGSGGHSPFTAALVKYVAEPGLDVRLALGKVRDDVLASTNGQQEPFVYGSLGGETVAIDPMKAEPVASATADSASTVRADYELAERIGTTKAWNLFLARYPKGFYADLARAQLAKLSASSPVVSQTSPPALQHTAEPPAASPKPNELQAPSVAVADARPGAQSTAQPEAVGTAKATAPTSRPPLNDVGKHSVPNPGVISPNPEPPASGRPPMESGGADFGSDASNSSTLAQKSPAHSEIASIESELPPKDRHKSVVLEAIRALQLQLRRVGCDPGRDIGLWGDESKRALEKFNRYAGTKLMVNVASIEALEVVKARKGRVCPLECRVGYNAVENRCVRGRRR